MVFHGDFPEFVVGALFAMAFENFLAFPFLVSFGHFVFFADFHDRIDCAFMLKGDLVAGIDAVSIGF